MKSNRYANYLLFKNTPIHNSDHALHSVRVFDAITKLCMGMLLKYEQSSLFVKQITMHLLL